MLWVCTEVQKKAGSKYGGELHSALPLCLPCMFMVRFFSLPGGLMRQVFVYLPAAPSDRLEGQLG